MTKCEQSLSVLLLLFSWRLQEGLVTASSTDEIRTGTIPNSLNFENSYSILAVFLPFISRLFSVQVTNGKLPI